MRLNKTTPILIVNAIEPCLPLWIERLGFEKTVEVPRGERLGFVILKRGSVEVMLQTLASIEEDVPAVRKRVSAGDVVLYTDVGALSEAKKAVEGLEVVVPQRKTFYGAKEIFVATPDGHILGFAEHE